MSSNNFACSCLTSVQVKVGRVLFFLSWSSFHSKQDVCTIDVDDLLVWTQTLNGVLLAPTRKSRKRKFCRGHLEMSFSWEKFRHSCSIWILERTEIHLQFEKAWKNRITSDHPYINGRFQIKVWMFFDFRCQMDSRKKKTEREGKNGVYRYATLISHWNLSKLQSNSIVNWHSGVWECMCVCQSWVAFALIKSSGFLFTKLNTTPPSSKPVLVAVAVVWGWQMRFSCSNLPSHL